ncbi:hypothetical protein ACVIVC_002010 [Sinorhizobium meliloti]
MPIQEIAEKGLDRCFIALVRIVPARPELCLPQRLHGEIDHALVQGNQVAFVTKGRDRPDAEQALIEKLLDRSVRFLAGRESAHAFRIHPVPAVHRCSPDVRCLADDVEPGARILPPLGVVRGGSRKAVRHLACAILHHRMKAADAAGRPEGGGTHLVRREIIASPIEEGVLDRLGHDCAAQLLKPRAEFGPQLAVRRVDRRPECGNDRCDLGAGAGRARRCLRCHPVEDAAVARSGLLVADIGPIDGQCRHQLANGLTGPHVLIRSPIACEASGQSGQPPDFRIEIAAEDLKLASRDRLFGRGSPFLA